MSSTLSNRRARLGTITGSKELFRCRGTVSLRAGRERRDLHYEFS